MREIFYASKGQQWRHEMALRIALEGAWMAVSLERRKRFPGLKPFMRECFPPEPDSHEAMQEQRERWLQWAAQNKLKVRKVKPPKDKSRKPRHGG